jgi:transcriptional regulator with XRE-family HTH domain
MTDQNPLDAWCECDGRSMEELAQAFGMSRVHLWRIRKSGTTELKVAKRIEKVTGGEVLAIKLLGLDRRDVPAAPKKKRKTVKA